MQIIPVNIQKRHREMISKFASKSFIGTGLGLFISKSIIEAHGGKIWAENNPDGKGVCLFIRIAIVLLMFCQLGSDTNQKFCVKCKMVLTCDAYSETIEEK